MPQNLYEILCIFFLYSFIGWCVEVTYVGLSKGHYVNRGFLNGPYCPIYGCGVLIVVAALNPVKANFLLLFLGSFLLCTVLEFLTGAVLEKIFQTRWWDYSDMPFNLKGYVCLKFSMFWGLGCTFIIDTVHPLIYKWIQWIPQQVGRVCLGIIIILFVIDICVTVNTIGEFNRRLKVLDEITAKMRRLSDELGEDILEKAMLAAEKAESLQQEELVIKLKERNDSIREGIEEQIEEQKEKIRQFRTLQEEFNQELRKRHSGMERMVKAFPNIASRKRKESLERFKEQVKEFSQKQ